MHAEKGLPLHVVKMSLPDEIKTGKLIQARANTYCSRLKGKNSINSNDMKWIHKVALLHVGLVTNEKMPFALNKVDFEEVKNIFNSLNIFDY